MPRLPRRASGCRGTTTAASPRACWTRSSAGCPRRGCSRPCARSAGSPTPSTRSPASSPTRARSASTSARGRTTSPRRWRSSPPSSTRLRERAGAPRRSSSARSENVKARIVLALESTGARMNRLGASLLYGLPLLETDEIMARIDAVTLDDLRALADELWAPERLSAAGIGPDEDAFRAAVAPVCPAAEPLRGVIRVAVAGAARAHGAGGVRRGRGRRRHGADRPRRPGARLDARPTCSATPTWSSTSRSPTRRWATRAQALDAGVHVVIGTTGFDLDELRAAADGRPANVFVAPELRDRRGADDALRRRGVEAHGARRDHRVPPPGQARRAVGHRRPHRRADGRRRADPLGAPAGHRRRPGGHPRRRRPDADASAT